MLLRNADSGSRAEERSFRVAHGSHPRVFVVEKMILIKAVVSLVRGCLCLGDGLKRWGSCFPLTIAANDCRVDCEVGLRFVLAVSPCRFAVLCEVCHCIYIYVAGWEG